MYTIVSKILGGSALCNKILGGLQPPLPPLSYAYEWASFQ